VSMVSLAKLYEIDARLRQIFQTTQPFGGRSMLVIVFETAKYSPFGFIIGNELWSLFKMYELTQIMRQNKALAFAVALNNMARGVMTPDDIELLNSRQMSHGLLPPSEAIHLFSTNKECAEFNERVHNSLDTESAVSHARDTIQGGLSDRHRAEFGNYLTTLQPHETDGLPLHVRLQVGAEYMVTTNVDVPDGIFNGSKGRLEHIQYSTGPDGARVPTTAYLSFASPMVGSEARSRHIYPSGVNKNWTPIAC
jgi:hypothetical protein